MLVFEQQKLVVPALPATFTIDASPKAFEDDFKEFLEKLLNEWSPSHITIEVLISDDNKKMNIFLQV